MPSLVLIAAAVARNGTTGFSSGFGGQPSVASLPRCPLPGACGVLDPVGSALPGLLARSIADVVVRWLTGGAVWVTTHALDLVGTTEADVGAAWFTGVGRLALTVATLVALPLALAGTIGAVLHQDSRRLARVWLVGVPVSLAGSGVAVALTALAVRVVDQLCTVIAPDGGATGLLATDVGRLTAAPQIVQMLLAGLIVLGGLALWLELVLRSAAIYVAVFFLPLALATLIWPALAAAARRFVEVLAALVVSKLVIVGALAVGTAALGSGVDGIDGAVTAAGILLLTAFMPFAVLRLVPIVEMAGISHLEGTSRRPLHAARQAVSLSTGPGKPVGAVLDHMANRTAGGLDLTPPPGSMGWREPDWFVPTDEPEPTVTKGDG